MTLQASLTLAVPGKKEPEENLLEGHKQDLNKTKNLRPLIVVPRSMTSSPKYFARPQASPGA